MSGSPWRVEVDATTCLGSGMCAALAPEFFVLGDTVATPVRAEVEPSDVLLDAADSCPAQAIRVLDPAGVEVGPRP